MPRFFIDFPLAAGLCDLPERAARHVQVLRLQPGDAITMFDGTGGEWQAVITDMKKRVAVELRTHAAVEREAERAITLAVGMPANDKMDWLVEKATELGVAAIQPLICERSVLRLRGERADKKRAHWQAVAHSACEQSGRNRVPEIYALQTFGAWSAGFTPSPLAGEGWGEGAASAATTARFILSTKKGQALNTAFSTENKTALFLSGPEGGLSAQEEQAALDAGFAPISLGSRVLRAETAPLAVLAASLAFT